MSEPTGTGTGRTNCLVAKLSHYIDLTFEERDFLQGLPTTEREMRRRDVLFERDEPTTAIAVVKTGWIYGYTSSPDGGQYVAELYFPGDLIGITHAGFVFSPLTFVAATEAVVCPVPKDSLRDVFGEHPRLLALIFSLATLEHVAMIDRMRAVGRMSARDCLAVFLLQVQARLRITGAADDGFEMPLSQETIGNVLGLSMVSVNRAFRQLEEDGCVRRDGRRVMIVDGKRLGQEVDFNDRHYVVDRSWFPAPAPAAAA